MATQELQHRYLHLDCRGLDEQTRTVPATLSTEEPVPRWNELEVLDHSESAVDLSRAKPSLPLLFNHDINVPIGVVERVRLENRTLKGLLRFGKSTKAEEIFREVADETITGLSIGYAIHETEPMPGGYRATKWVLYEGSITPVQADIRAGINRGKTMENQNQTQTQDTTTRASHEQEILTREQQRRQEIRGVFDLFKDRAGIADLLNRCLDDYQINVESARQLLLTELGKDCRPLVGNKATRSDANLQYPGEGRGLDFRTIASGYDATRDFQTAAVDALLLRNGIRVDQPHVAARDLQRMSVTAMAEVCLRQCGLSTSGMPADRILQRAITHTSGDFAQLLANTANKALMQGFENEPASHRVWVRNVEVADFKPQSRVRMGSAPDLVEVLEGGEVKHGTMGEQGESYRLRSFARIFSISRVSLVNDDLQALTRIPEAFGRAGARKEADVVYTETLLANPTLADGVALFHADHGNIGTAASLSSSSLGEARTLMRMQKNGAKGFLNVVPRFLIVPARLETWAEQLIASTVDPAALTAMENARFIRNLQLVVEPRLDAISETAWYLAADPAQADTIETAYLQGQRGAFTESEEGFEVLGMKWRCVLDFGCGVLDYTGLVKNAGA